MCGRAVHPTGKMLDYASRVRMEEREAEEHEWTETKMREHITVLEGEIVAKRRELKHAQKQLLQHVRRRSA